jgi:hypothetical protein
MWLDIPAASSQHQGLILLAVATRVGEQQVYQQDSMGNSSTTNRASWLSDAHQRSA